jgi:hypothetical protein
MLSLLSRPVTYSASVILGAAVSVVIKPAILLGLGFYGGWAAHRVSNGNPEALGKMCLAYAISLVPEGKR